MSQHPISRALISVLAGVLACLPALAGAAEDKQDFSAAERLLFMTDQLRNVHPPTALRYSFQKSGSFETGFKDTVNVQLTRRPDGRCCSVKGEFLSGERRVTMPELEQADGNPVTLYFLEHDIREMQRLTKGSQTHFRKQIRLAVYQAVTVREVTLVYRGKSVHGQQVTISPYLDDPNRPRFEKFASKVYQFSFSDEVPGGVYGIRSQIAGEAPDAPALLVEEMLLDGAEPAPR